MKIPSRLDKILKKNISLHGAVEQTIAEFEPWINANRTVFFPEYTDHGPAHIEAVFDAAASLISDASYRLISPEDVATLLLSILVHDIGMHLTKESFCYLVNPNSPQATVSKFAQTDRPWLRIWDEFVHKAMRWNSKKRKDVLGTTEWMRRPPDDPDQFTELDCKLIGEFVRLHHPRLAHEIALHGVPSPRSPKLAFVQVPEPIANFAGMVARSHGRPIREALDWLQRDEQRVCHNVHVPFLMVLLRIADYFQIQSARAPKQLLQVQKLKSPLSQQEHAKHLAVQYIHNELGDPEALFINAVPIDVNTYLGLKWLLADIQKELDASWAALGEIYGGSKKLKGLGMPIRRIRSNLDDEVAITPPLPFLPWKLAFETDPAVLKLLIGPLYNDEPSYAIRELMQNAVDACWAIKGFRERHAVVHEPDATQEQDVLIHIDIADDSSGSLTMSDKGIGMTPEIVRDYFLKAGASFRKSDAWTSEFENDAGNARILRSGRFGIGVLAAFLLGDKIEVSTRHVTESKGIQFICGVEDDSIELRPMSRPVGTTIKVHFNLPRGLSFASDMEDWNWWCLGEPTVLCETRGRWNDRFQQQILLPNKHADLPPNWRRTIDPDYEDIQWTFSMPSRSILMA
ncbi:MAG: hypothetical protein JWL77_482 [Chthonomonadaceae bacterium]|nr:hypothetical protein [Chthonomonadaceae bacterium]